MYIVCDECQRKEINFVLERRLLDFSMPRGEEFDWCCMQQTLLTGDIMKTGSTMQ